MNSSLAKEIKLLAELAEMKRIYAVIENTLPKSNPSSLVVTSGLPGEGKTTMAAVLATIAARQSTKRVLAVDLNWYTPALHSWFGLNPTPAVVIDDRKKSIVELAQSSGSNNLDILTARQSTQNKGEPHIDTLERGTEIMRQAYEDYDFVVVDTSSIFPTNRRMMDPVTISKAADGVALVVLANISPRPPVKRAHLALETVGANVLGVIVNQWKNPNV
jgi:protein-tyrosine kinase